MTQYMLSVYMVEGEAPYADDEETQASYKTVDVFNQELQDSEA